MNSLRTLATLMLVLGLAFALAACSGGKTPVDLPATGLPAESSNESLDNPFDYAQDKPESFGNAANNRNVIAVYDCEIDPDAGTFTITPNERAGSYHFPLSQLYPNVLSIVDFDFVPNFWADIRLDHPLPDSDIDGYDARVIAILPANPGVSMNYPALQVYANNSVLLGPHGYTQLFDDLGGAIAGNTNPFRAYFKDEPNRVWSSTDTTYEIQRWNMNLAGFGGPLVFKLVVDVSTNFPSSPEPGTDNAPEPVQIEATIGTGLTPYGGTATIDVTLLDWQGKDGIGRVLVESPGLFTGLVELEFSDYGPNPDEYIYTGTIVNELVAPAGVYKTLVVTCDQQTGVYICDEFEAVCDEEILFNPEDVTPPWLIFTSEDVFIDSGYAYTVGGLHGLHIFDISDKTNPVWVNKVDLPGVELSGHRDGVHVYNGYAYVTNRSAGLQIVDVDPPEDANIVKTIDIEWANCVYVSGDGYAYVSGAALYIIDINPPEEAYIVKTVSGGGAYGVYVTGGYAYAAGSQANLNIIDIEPPEEAYVVKTISTPGSAVDVSISGGYAYVADGGSGLSIFDIDPPESALYMTSVDTPGNALSVCIVGDYAHVADGNSGLQIIDIGQDEPEHIVRSVDTPGNAYDVHISAGYAYVADINWGLLTIDIDPPTEADIVDLVDMPTPSCVVDVCVSGDYAYVADSSVGRLIIIDIDPSESAHIVKTVDTPGSARDVYVSGGYAYVADGDLQIIDIDPIESAHIVKTLSNNIIEVHVSGDYAYAIASGYLSIWDIHIPEDAYWVKSVQCCNGDVYVSGGYAYVACGDLKIIDVDPPEEASVVKILFTPGAARGVYVSGVYAYVADGDAGLRIADIETPLVAYWVGSIDTPGDAREVHVSCGYGFVVDGNAGLQIIDVIPPGDGHIVNSLDTLDNAVGIYVSDGYAYVADDGFGLRIIDLY